MNLLRGKQTRRLHQHRRLVQALDRRGRALLHASTSPPAARPTASPRSRRETEWHLDPRRAYVHICANETIIGLEYHWTPDTGDVPLVADMSSNILSRPIDVGRYGLIYAGAQKNIGPAGLDAGDRPRGPARRRAGDDADAFNYTGPGGQRLDAQHAADLRDLPRRPGVRLDQGARRPGGDGRAQPRQGGAALRRHRRERLLPHADRPGRPLAHERHLPPARRRRSTRRSSRAPRSAAWSRSRATAPSAASARRSTTPCRSRACAPWSRTCGSSRPGTAEASARRLVGT